MLKLMAILLLVSSSLLAACAEDREDETPPLPTETMAPNAGSPGASTVSGDNGGEPPGGDSEDPSQAVTRSSTTSTDGPDAGDDGEPGEPATDVPSEPEPGGDWQPDPRVPDTTKTTPPPRG